MLQLFDRWLAVGLLNDPLRRTQAQLLQRFALILLVAAFLSIPTALIAQAPIERLIGAVSSVVLLVILIGSLLLLWRGHLLISGLLIIISIAANVAINMSTTGLEGSRAIFALLVVPIVLGGLLANRWLLLTALIICTLVPIGIVIGETTIPGLVGYQPNTYDPLLTIITFVVCAGMVAVVVWYFGSTLQQALRAALGRERDLDLLRTSLEEQVAERTAQLKGALDDVRTQSAEQSVLLETLERQQSTIRELSIPILPLSATMLVIPLVGELDHERLQDLLMRALTAIEQSGAQTLLLDVTGVPIVDTQVASGIVSVGRAARLLGANVTLIGVRPEVAQTIVALGVDLSGIDSAPSMASVLAKSHL